ncbi:MAG: hypothetical protein QOF46_3248 [Paraburkholderia sp.]|nr:hypothetical protein [Paraburkholderia sp.]
MKMNGLWESGLGSEPEGARVTMPGARFYVFTPF